MSTRTDHPARPASLLAPLRGAHSVRTRTSPEPATSSVYGACLAVASQANTVSVDAPRRADIQRRGVDARVAAPALAGFLVAGVVLLVLAAPVIPGGVGRTWTILVTGLTAGGLSCLAVQGGLLAAAVRAPDALAPVERRTRIVVFLLAKLVAYTLLGALLGLFGAAMQPSPFARGAIQVVVGLFMLGTGVRMVWPHPWLRFLVLEPPARVTRAIRRRARSAADHTTAAWLGAVTVLIPCGVTQAMLAGAMATASPVAGAATMALFTLGTSPIFFSLAFAAGALGRHAERVFNRVVAVLVIVLGYVAIQTGFALAGHPLPVRPIFMGLAPSSQQAADASTTKSGTSQIAQISVIADGYKPALVRAQAETPLTLRFVTHKLEGCTSTLVVPSLKLQRVLKPTGQTDVEIPAQPAGTKLRWLCGMGMYTGTVEYR